MWMEMKCCGARPIADGGRHDLDTLLQIIQLEMTMETNQRRRRRLEREYPS